MSPGITSYILACQEDSHLRTLDTVVLSCENLSNEERAKLFLKQENDGKDKQGTDTKKKKKQKGTVQDTLNAVHTSGSEQNFGSTDTQLFKVLLSESVFFPEGGGQPYDRGILLLRGAGTEDTEKPSPKSIEVIAAFRDSITGDAWVVTRCPVEQQAVTCVVDWARRRDHMEHHSAQHLISSIALRDFGFKTVGWSLTDAGPAVDAPCYVDFESERRVTEQDLAQIEATAKADVAAALALSPKVFSPQEFQQLQKSGDVRFKALPNSDFPVRTIEIAGIETSTCCGTHVKSTAELGCIKLLRAEALARTSTEGRLVSRVMFVAGARSYALLGNMYSRQRDLTAVLSSAPEEHTTRVSVLAASLKEKSRALACANKELGEILGAQLYRAAREKAQENGVISICYHKSGGTTEFINSLEKSILNEAAPRDNVVAFLSIGDETKPPHDGAYILVCKGETIPDSFLQSCHSQVLEILQARGGGKGKRFQGKVPAGCLSAKVISQLHSKFTPFMIVS